MDLRELDKRALDGTERLIALVSKDQLRLPTPCADWTLYGLVRHMVSHNLGFAAAARGDEPDLALWDSGRLGDDPLRAYRASVREVTAAFATEDVLDRVVELPELNTSLPGRVAIGFHFLDYLVHGWDVAKTIGAPTALDGELAAAAVELFSRPRPAIRSKPVRAPFAESIPLPDNASVEDQLLSSVGRDPNWSAA